MAYYLIKRNKLIIIIKHGFPTELVELICAKQDGSKSSIWAVDEISISFVTLDELGGADFEFAI